MKIIQKQQGEQLLTNIFSAKLGDGDILWLYKISVKHLQSDRNLKRRSEKSAEKDERAQ